MTNVTIFELVELPEKSQRVTVPVLTLNDTPTKIPIDSPSMRRIHC